LRRTPVEMRSEDVAESDRAAALNHEATMLMVARNIVPLRIRSRGLQAKGRERRIAAAQTNHDEETDVSVM
jgi:hypothetical protein